MPAHPIIDQFYLDEDFGVIKFAGYEDGLYLFHSYSNLNVEKRWKETLISHVLHPAAFDAKRTHGLIKPSVPPI